jgi:TorA maturation chaperone TorD
VAAGEDLETLGVLHAVEPTALAIEALRADDFPACLGLALRSEEALKGTALMTKALTDLSDPVCDGDLDTLAVDFADIYLNHALQASPSESVWVDEEGLERQEPMFQVRDCYRRHGLEASDWRHLPDDHLSLQLWFLAFLFHEGARDVSTADGLGEAARFMDEHLLRWLPMFSERVSSHCESPYFTGLALLTDAYCSEIRDLLADILGEPRPDPEQAHRRLKPESPSVEVAGPYMPGMGPIV